MRDLQQSRRGRAGTLFLMIVAGPLSSACGETLQPIVCTDEFVFGLLVDVHEGTGGPGADGAIGVAIEGVFADTLQSFDPARMVGAGERPGTYEVTVRKDGFASWSASNITVTADECHVIPVRLQAVLIPVVSMAAVAPAEKGD